MRIVSRIYATRTAAASCWLLLVVAACGGAGRDASEGHDAEARGGEIGGAYVDALEDAEAVEDLARERKERLDAATESPD